MSQPGILCSNCQGSRHLRQPPSHPNWSQLRSLLRDNQHPFRSTQSTEISQSLSQAPEVVQWYEDEISRLKAHVISLENQHADAHEHVKEHESLLAPIRKIPPEVLRKVFGQYCENNSFCSTVNVPGFVLGAVCSHWRTLSISFPELWTAISLDTTVERFSESLKPALQCVLERTGELALTVSICDESTTPNEESCLGLLVGQSHRCVRANLDLAKDAEALAGLKNRLSRLRSLDLSLETTVPCSIFLNAPLEELMCSVSWSVAVLWNQIRRLSFTKPEINRDLLLWLSQRQCLEMITCKLPVIRRNNPAEEGGLVLPIRALEVIGYRDVQKLFRVMRFVAVRLRS